MRKSIRLLLMFLFALRNIVAAAPGDTLSVELVTPGRSLDPGKMHNLVFRVTNRTSDTLRLSGTFTLPAGWRLALPQQNLTLPPGHPALLMASISIPSGFPAGRYGIKTTLTSPLSGSLLAETEAQFLIPEKDDFSLDLLNAPDHVRAGEQFSTSWILRNKGNISRKFSITTVNCDVEGPIAVTLPPGGSTTISVIGRPDKEITTATSYNYSIEITRAGSTDLSGENSRRDFRSVKVFPLRESDNDLWFRYPVTVASRFLMRSRDGKSIAGTQFEARGSGALDTTGIHKIDFMARGPNNQELSFLGLYDEYSLAYTGPHVESFIGHKSFHVTPLMETARYGTGTQQTYLTSRGDRFGFLYLQPRFYRDIRHEAAAYAEVALPRNHSIGIHYLTKTGFTPAQKAHLGSFTAHLRPFEATTAEFEYSLGRSNGRNDHAWRLFLHTQHRLFSLSANYYHAGQFYPGYYHNSVFYNGNLQLRLSPRWSLGLSAREDFSNAASDTLLTTAPFSRMIMASSYFRWNRQLSVRLYYLDMAREDRMPQKKFDYRTASLNGEIDHQFTRFGYRLGGEYGQTNNYLADAGSGHHKNSYRGSLHLTYKPSYHINIQAFTSYTNINSFLSREQENWMWGMSAYGQPARNLRTTLQFQNSFAIEDYYLNRNLFQFTLDYRFLRRHQLSATSYYMLFQNKTEDPELTLSLTWSVQLGVPLRKTAEAGSFSGLLTKANGEPAKGVLFYLNGRTALTDERGRFSFRNLIPGSYDLLAGRDHLELDEITDVPLPAKIHIHADEEAHLALQLIRAGRIRGRITFPETADLETPRVLRSAPPAAPAAPGTPGTSGTPGTPGTPGDSKAGSLSGAVQANPAVSLPSPPPAAVAANTAAAFTYPPPAAAHTSPPSGGAPTPSLAHVVLDLHDGLETIRILTNASGEFEFPRVRPGEWTLRVYKNNIDPRFNLEKENYQLTVTGGETTEVEIRLLPKNRTIIFKPSALVVATTDAQVKKP